MEHESTCQFPTSVDELLHKKSTTESAGQVFSTKLGEAFAGWRDHVVTSTSAAQEHRHLQVQLHYLSNSEQKLKDEEREELGHQSSEIEGIHEDTEWISSKAIDDTEVYPCDSNEETMALELPPSNHAHDPGSCPVQYHLGACWFTDPNSIDDGSQDEGFITPSLFLPANPPGSDNRRIDSFSVDISDHAGKHSAVLWSDSPSPVHMEHFVPLVYPPVPEMLFEDVDLAHLDFVRPPPLFDTLQPYTLHQHPQPLFSEGSDDQENRYYQQPFYTSQHMESNATHQYALYDHHQHVQHDGYEATSANMMKPEPTTFVSSSIPEPVIHFGEVEQSTTASSIIRSHAPRQDQSLDNQMYAGIRKPNNRQKRNNDQPPLLERRTRRSTSASANRSPVSQPSQSSGRPHFKSAMTTITDPEAATEVSTIASVQLLTKLNSCYWKNGRKNLQCFPICPEHLDFYSMKMNNRKHSSVGVCRGPVYCHAFTVPAVANATAASRSCSSAHHMKYEHGVGATGSGGGSQELFVLGRFERVPQHDTTTTVGLLEQLRPPPQFSSLASFEEFRYGCFQAVEMEERRTLVSPTKTPYAATASIASTRPLVRSTWFFLPDVWKVQSMLKKKRKATRAAPAQTFPFCFRVFIYVQTGRANGSGHGGSSPSSAEFTCIASTVSSFFELYSTRTVDRVRRKHMGGNRS